MEVGILFIVPKYPYPIQGGLEKQAFILARELVKLGLRVTVLSLKFSIEQQDFICDEGVEVYRIRGGSNSLSRIIQIFKIPVFLWKRRHFYDIVHIHQHSYFGLYCHFWSKTLGFKVVQKLPNLGRRGLIGLASSRFGSIKIGLLKRSDALIAMTDSHFNELKLLGFKESLVCSIPNGVVHYRDLMEQRKGIEFQNAGVRFCYIGRLERQKGIMFLLEAWKVVVGDSSIHTLEICGDGSLVGDISKFVSDNDLSRSVFLSGYTDKVSEVLERSDVFVITSETEGMSNAILEAMAFGKSIIASKVGAAHIQFKSNFSNSVFELNDQDKLVELIKLNMNNHDFRLYNERVNWERSHSFKIDIVAKKYMSLYYALAAGAPLPEIDYDY